MNGERTGFFGKPGEEVAASISGSWAKHPDRQETFQGSAAIIGLETPNGLRFFRLDNAYYYNDEYTKKRWPNTRGPELASMQPGEVVGYQFHQTVLTFIKVGPVGDASNIQLAELTEVDKFGDPILGGEAKLKAGKAAALLGLESQSRGQITPFHFRNTEGLLITAGSRTLSSEEIARIEEEILRADL